MSIEPSVAVESLEDLLTTLRGEKPALGEQYEIQSLGVFGSFVRGGAAADSDLDLLVKFSSPPTLFEIVRLQNELSDRLGLKVDLVMRSALKPVIGTRIIDEVILV